VSAESSVANINRATKLAKKISVLEFRDEDFSLGGERRFPAMLIRKRSLALSPNETLSMVFLQKGQIASLNCRHMFVALNDR
jgi:hypothetical protein